MNIKTPKKPIEAILAGKDFILDASNQKVMAALNYDGLENARFVGGCVRNSLLGEEVKDIDIATKLWPREIISALEANNIRYVPTGIDHGTISAIIDNRAIEITTLRRDVLTDGRRAKVQFTDDWQIDASRRDFTFNALYCDAKGVVYDPLGTGVKDALARNIVFIGKSCERIKEDYLRILRFFRLYAWYGRGELDKSGVEACDIFKDGLSGLSVERVWSELKKLLAAPNPIYAIEIMDRIGVFSQIIGEEIDVDRFKALVTIENELVKDADPILRFMALLDRNRDTNQCKICDKFKFSNQERSRMQSAFGAEKIEIGLMDTKQIRRLIYKYQRQTIEDAVILQWSIDKSIANYAKWHALFNCLGDIKTPIFPVGGKDLLRYSVIKGPKVGELLRELEKWWIEEDFTMDKIKIDAKLSQLVANHNQ